MNELVSNTYVIHKEQELQLTIGQAEHASIQIVLEQDATALKLHLQVLQDANVKVFVHNQSQQAVHFESNVHVLADAFCQMGVLDIEDHPFSWKQYTSLDEEGASYEVLSAQLSKDGQKKLNDMEVVHHAPHTNGEMKNFAVLFDKGHYEMVANGNITKGCFDASSHQATRVLTLGKDHVAKCIPLLLIDENEVKASHALTVGQPDADQLYYLQSRGLTTQQAIGLLSIGYFLPILDFVEDEQQRNALREEMERKVGLYGHSEN